MKQFKQKVMIEITFDRMVTEKEARLVISYYIPRIKKMSRAEPLISMPKIKKIASKEGNRVLEAEVRAYKRSISKQET
jgi:hypothetical protein